MASLADITIGCEWAEVHWVTHMAVSRGVYRYDWYTHGPVTSLPNSEETHRGVLCPRAYRILSNSNGGTNYAVQEITVTNYTGDARDYLKKLIVLMGATFTPSMSGKNTVLIAA